MKIKDRIKLTLAMLLVFGPTIGVQIYFIGWVPFLAIAGCVIVYVTCSMLLYNLLLS